MLLQLEQNGIWFSCGDKNIGFVQYVKRILCLSWLAVSDDLQKMSDFCSIICERRYTISELWLPKRDGNIEMVYLLSTIFAE